MLRALGIIKKFWYLGIVFLLCVVIGAFMLSAYHKVDQIAAVQTSEYLPTIVLDAGHGGEDGGAVGINDMHEKDVNLAITRYLRDMLTASGFPVVMLRDGDYSIHDANLPTVKERKASDLRNRLKQINSYENCIFLSIHQNHFTEKKYSGAQMFYSTKTPESKVLAEMLRTAVTSLLQPNNKREIKPATKSIYLLYNAEQTAVLAECGFLSNPQEAEKLASKEYQQQMAFSLYCGLLDYWRQVRSKS